MAKANKTIAPPLIDAVRPMDADGPLVSLICSTYGLSLDQPNFFEQDFLPTVLGLGGVRDRGYAVPVAMERKLKEVYSALVADAHALADGGRCTATIIFPHQRQLSFPTQDGPEAGDSYLSPVKG